jgi:fucose permease
VTNEVEFFCSVFTLFFGGFVMRLSSNNFHSLMSISAPILVGLLQVCVSCLLDIAVRGSI